MFQRSPPLSVEVFISPERELLNTMLSRAFDPLSPVKYWNKQTDKQDNNGLG